MRSTARWPAAGVSLALLLLLGAAGCGSGRALGDGGVVDRTPREPMPLDATTIVDADTDTTVVDGSACAFVIESHPDEGAQHIPCSSPATYLSEPPSSGNHYPIWAAYQAYDAPVPWGNLVHCLEHGAVVMVYNCPAGCADEVDRALAWIAALPADPVCGANRIVLAPDPTLGVRWAATAWTWTLRADCFDETAFTQFFADHYGHGLEVVCSSGANTAAGWCP